ncbi:methionine--tRNA ligase, partial [Salinispira pacifica]
MSNTKKRLITSALPYVNNIPHLGNLIQVLSADVFARYCRLRGYDTLYICGTDEYGTATETRALEEGITPRELCDRYYRVHSDIYSWFNISFDKFGRTSTPEHTTITQGIFLDLYKAGYIVERTIQQLYSEKSKMFLADRYVRGTCPHCGYADARGDQCENCGKLLDPSELIEPRSIIDDSRPVMRETSHLYINLPAILPKLEAWMKEASGRGNWSRNAVQMTQAWIRDGLKERSITRDLKWGIPVPLDAYSDKVFYVWFDAPIGYISITASLTDKWEEWWKNPSQVELFQFIGKDNIPFHTVVFPCSLLGSGRDWTMLHHMSSTEYLNYESGKFSKSKGVGVFGNDAMETGIPADVWRFYMFYNRPETSDSLFTWADFQEKVNGELIGNLSNLVNRTLTFVSRYFEGEVPPGPTDAEREAEIYPGAANFWEEVGRFEREISDTLEWAGLRDAFRKVFLLSSYGNRIFQAAEPWKTRNENPASARALIHDLVYLVRDLAVLTAPYIPGTADRIAGFLGRPSMDWRVLGTHGEKEQESIGRIERPEILFKQLENDQIEELRA